MTETSAILLWVRRDLRLSDHPAFAAAAATGRPVIPVFVADAQVAGMGAAPRWRLEQGLAAFGKALSDRGSRLILRRGDALEVLGALAAETGAGAVWWSRLYDAPSRERDGTVKATLKDRGIDARSFPGHLLHEPWTVATGSGGYYKVYTPFWRAVKDRAVPEPEPAPARLRAPERWPASEDPGDWRLGAAMGRGAPVVARYARIGEATAQGRLGHFLAHVVADYRTSRDLPGEDGTSQLSENLSLGEIGPRTVWHAGLRALHEGKAGAETFLQELVWRDFAWHLLYHTPHLATDNWKPDWDSFPWSTEVTDAVRAWQRGRTGLRFVDAGMREMYVTGRMHNRARMLVASVLTKHLLTHWKIGLRWFEEHLTDWDPASNAMGWQWSAGSGPDATPYFRVFNPVTQLDKFDPARRYVDTWIAEGKSRPAPQALDYFAAIPERWGMSPADPYPAPVIGPKEGRARALEAYGARGR